MSTRLLVSECFDGKHDECRGYNGPADDPNFLCACDCHFKSAAEVTTPLTDRAEQNTSGKPKPNTPPANVEGVLAAEADGQAGLLPCPKGCGPMFVYTYHQPDRPRCRDYCGMCQWAGPWGVTEEEARRKWNARYSDASKVVGFDDWFAREDHGDREQLQRAWVKATEVTASGYVRGLEAERERITAIVKQSQQAAFVMSQGNGIIRAVPPRLRGKRKSVDKFASYH